MTAQDYIQQALIHHRAGNLPLAEQLYNQALALDPQNPDALHFLGTLAHQSHQDERAIQLLTKAFQLKPSPRTLNNLGEAYRALDRFDDALRCFSTATQMVPTYAEAHQNLGVVLAYQLKLSAALAAYDKAIQLQPDNAEAHVNRALVYLQQGNYLKGFEEYEWRQHRPDCARAFDVPRWTGAKLRNDQTLLLWSEQGFGDTLQFVRFIPQLLAAQTVEPRQKGALPTAPNVILETQPELLPLLKHTFQIPIIPRGAKLPPFDFQCPLMSLPHILRTTLQSLPNAIPYLNPPPDPQTRLSQIPSQKIKIGIAWASNALHPTAKRRSCTLADLLPLAAIPNATLISLQKGPAAQEAESHPDQILNPELTDFADTAAVIAQLDHVITVDTAIAHLAGALGKPVSILLPVSSEWRWLLNRNDSPWYPTATLFRQSTPRNWSPVVENLLQTLQ
jgi:Tfp pilus assembly protein PilF